MKLVFEIGSKGRRLSLLPECDVPEYRPGNERKTAPRLPEASENDLSRHYKDLENEVFGMNDGMIPLGSCTMKYNPKINEQEARLPGFTDIHPLQPAETVEGCREVIDETKKALCEITGMDRFTLQPSAGAHGEFTGLLTIKKYHDSRNDKARTKIIVPDSAHGTNPASAAMAGFSIVNVKSTPEGIVDLDALREAVGPDTAGLMLTNPNTLGIFDRNIKEITDIIHEAGGLCYYDGANLNAVIGEARPGDMGFDVVHLNLHKTFSTPHACGGPGAGPVGCKAFLKDFLPEHVRTFDGNFLVVVRALTYIKMLGGDGLAEVSRNAVLNANYVLSRIAEKYSTEPAGVHYMHEFVITLQKEKKEHDVTALDIAKTLMDYGIHPPTMYFPLIVHEALMVEPTETEPKEMLDYLADSLNAIYDKALEDPAYVHASPHTAYITRPDEVKAARKPVVKYDFE
ncbi:MAG: aminomethyl-transferring glycine dehydrogenase subunit GcvPB [Anaerovoracaceae bacterium]|nr:aminomethyl-transferring glycine dehydrogenase subunit GcvPB [Anaerovoracaceae bacterium]